MWRAVVLFVTIFLSSALFSSLSLKHSCFYFLTLFFIIFKFDLLVSCYISSLTPYPVQPIVFASFVEDEGVENNNFVLSDFSTIHIINKICLKVQDIDCLLWDMNHGKKDGIY